MRTNNKLNPQMITSPGIEPKPHWWEASTLTTAPRVLIRRQDLGNQDTQESVPAYFQTEHKEIHFKCNFLPSYSPIAAPLLQNLMKPLCAIPAPQNLTLTIFKFFNSYDFLPGNRCGKDAVQVQFLPEVNETGPLLQLSLVKLAPCSLVQHLPDT